MSENPTATLDISFDNYVSERQRSSSQMEEGGIANYAYGQDYILRQKIKAIPGIFAFFKALNSSVVPLERQKYIARSIKTGPNQLPEIYNMGVECAKRLGIGIPTIFLDSQPGTLNAFAFCVDDEAPLIIVNSSLIERFTPGEIKAVIGHECGHIHNNHGLYNIAAEVLINVGLSSIPALRPFIQTMALPILLLFKSWSRAAEVTCDRAGMICSDKIEDAMTAEAKLMSGGAFNIKEINIDELIKQYDEMAKSPARFNQLMDTHPAGTRRILADKEFSRSEVLYKWRPEWKKPGMELIDKKELDFRCDKFINVWNKSKAGDK